MLTAFLPLVLPVVFLQPATDSPAAKSAPQETKVAASAPVEMKWSKVEKEASSQIGSYRPVPFKMTTTAPAEITKSPQGLEAAMYGVIPMASGKKFHFVLDEPEGKASRLFVDANGDGDLTNDAQPKWEARPSKGRDGKEYTMYFGSASVNIATDEAPFNAMISMYRFDKTDPMRANTKETLYAFRDYAVAGDIKLGGNTYKAMLSDDQMTGDFRGKADGADGLSGVNLYMDVNGNGRFDSRGEMYDVRQPFKIRGVVYEIAELSQDGTSFKVVESTKQVDEVLPPPDHGVGKKATPFEAVGMDGASINFPGTYKGKIVLVDFWATWCGPCIAEAPNVVAVYKDFADKGFDVLGISLDNKDATDKINAKSESLDMKWKQIYDGGGWNTRIAKLYGISSIPATYLVDGDSGEILAVNLRGPKLREVVESSIKAKAASKSAK